MLNRFVKVFPRYLWLKYHIRHLDILWDFLRTKLWFIQQFLDFVFIFLFQLLDETRLLVNPPLVAPKLGILFLRWKFLYLCRNRRLTFCHRWGKIKLWLTFLYFIQFWLHRQLWNGSQFESISVLVNCSNGSWPKSRLIRLWVFRYRHRTLFSRLNNLSHPRSSTIFWVLCL